MNRKIKLIARWARMFAGKSYYHMPQGLGKAFSPSALKGYFNDLSAKTDWKGAVDAKGIPLTRLIDGRRLYFAIAIAQKALGHHDLFLIAGDQFHKNIFLDICEWLRDSQDERGGLDVREPLMLKGPYRYSAMAQGEAVSALVRAWAITRDQSFMDAAGKSYRLLISPIEEGGTAALSEGRGSLEEYPADNRNTVLNGWIFALFGVYDFWLASGDASVKLFFDKSFSSMRSELGKYDSGFWTYYDEKHGIASPFYHDLHISQLKALHLVTGDETVLAFHDRWVGYTSSRYYKFKALAIKIKQKIIYTPEAVIVE